MSEETAAPEGGGGGEGGISDAEWDNAPPIGEASGTLTSNMLGLDQAPEPETPEERDTIDKLEASNAATAEGKLRAAQREEGEAPPEPDDDLFDLEQFGDKKFKLKIDGEEKLVPLKELLNEEHIGAERMRLAAQKRFEEAAKARKQLEALVLGLDDDLPGILSTRGEGSISKAMRQMLASDNPMVRQEVNRVIEELEAEARMTPEQREQKRYQQEREKFERERDEWQSERQKEQRAAETRQHVESFQKSFTSALQAHRVPVTPHTIARMAAHAEAAMSKGMRLPAEEIAQRVRDEMREGFKSYMGDMDEDALQEFLGEERLRALRKRDAQAVAARQSQRGASRPPGRKAQKRSLEDFRDELEETRYRKRR